LRLCSLASWREIKSVGGAENYRRKSLLFEHQQRPLDKIAL